MRTYSSSGGRGNMRHGLISLLTVVVVISLATAAVLAVSTAHAMGALASRQGTMTAQGYALERSGQKLLAVMDEELAAGQRAGESGAAIVTHIDNRINSLLVEACADDVTATHERNGNTFVCTFVSNGGRMLTVTVTVGGNATYDVTGWQLTAAPQVEDTGDTLWTGSTAGD